MPEVHAPSLVPDAVRAAAALAAEHTEAAEAARQLTPEVVGLVVRAGFAAHFVPEAHGGPAGSFTELLPAVALLGESCPSTAWFASLTACVGRMAAYLPEEGRRRVWENGPHTLLVGALAPSGVAEPVSGGWRVRGQWPYVSGVAHSDWALVCARTATGEESHNRFFAVPRGAYGIVESWSSIGMRATGSDTLTLQDVVVPAESSVAVDDLLSGPAPDAKAPCHRVPLKAANGLTLAAPLLGAARGALRRWHELVQAKLGTSGGSLAGTANRTSYDLTLARADGETEAAGLLLRRVAEVADGDAHDALLTARNNRDCTLATEFLTDAVGRLLRTSGSRGQAEEEGLQRFWRDVNVGAGHATLQFAPAATAFARRLTSAAAG